MKLKLSKVEWKRIGKQAGWMGKVAGQYRGNQYRETPQESFMTMIRHKPPNAVLMNENKALELWTQDDKASGYVLDIGGIGYRFVKIISGDELKQYDIYSLSGKEWNTSQLGRWGEIIKKSMARTFYVTAWADNEEEEGRGHSGEELFSVAPPKIPPSAMKEAVETIEQIEMLNHMSIDDLFAKAVQMDMPGVNDDVLQHEMGNLADDFGYCMAMASMGHGVNWTDDHEDIGIKYPHVEYYWQGDE